MKIKVISPYFGKFPPFFDLFLESCRYNPEITFLIFTDQHNIPLCPPNVEIFQWQFFDLKKMIQGKLSLNIKAMYALSPYKLCDYKPAYGKLFEDYLEGADFWGFCDMDLIFGKIFNILSLDKLSQSERILTQGHLTFYKNSHKMNMMFTRELENGISFAQAISFSEPAFFDEIFMPEICKENDVIQYGENVFADILPQYATFVVAPTCTITNRAKQRFCWKNGRLFQMYRSVDSEETLSEIMYIHFQKRPLTPFYSQSDLNGKARIYFTPQGIFPDRLYTNNVEESNKLHVINYHRKRWQSLTWRKIWVKYRINKLLRK
ncbi:DUF6625 family protein [Bacteroides sp. AN502(2024)]|uniref:DUF6625 family protein n=1 Tax=Bacteroides sp. AN502(2024) TaxID=3160599 RepID=UPI003517E48A